MRILILIALLCNTAFSSLYLNGATYTQTVTINHTSVSETNGHFLFQRKIPRTGSIALSVDSANDVGITRINDTTRIPRWVVFTTDTIYLYADIAVSSTVDTSYRIQYGKALNEVNTSATFTNCDVTNYVGANSTAQDATVLNYVTSENLVVTSTAITGSQGLFSNGLEFFGTSDGKVTFGNEMVGTGDITISAMVKRKSTAQTYQYILYNGAFELYFQTSNGNLYIHNSNTTYKQVSAALPELDVWYFLVVRISSDGLCQVFINGSAVGVSSSSGPRATGPSAAYIGAKNTAYRLSSYVDEFMTRNVLATSSAIVDRYNMLFNPTTFSTLGTPATQSKWGTYKNLGIDLKLF